MLSWRMQRGLMLNCRVYPNGEFSIWSERKSTKIEPPPEQPDYLGLSLLPNSHRVAIGASPPPPERSRRGLKGISRLGARTVRNAAFLLEKEYGIDRLSFLTCTLPFESATAEYAAGREWAEIVRIFLQKLGRLLKAAGLPGSIVSCTEIQEKRYQERGGMPLHLHLVFVGKRARKNWAIGKYQFRSAWASSVMCRCPEFKESDWKAATRVETVRKSVEGYLGKYMTKGSATLSKVIEEDPGIAEFLPSAWWNCSLKLKRAVGKRITGGYSTARKLIKDIRASDTRVDFHRTVEIQDSNGFPVPVAIIGRLSGEGRNSYGWKPGRVPQQM